MKPILVIADDLTGAAEIGGIGVQHGLSARIWSLKVRIFGGADLLVINTDSRHLPASQAAACVANALRGNPPNRFSLIYKKTDSLLRGPVAAEIGAMLDALHSQRAVLAPQNPKLGRTIRDGVYLVHDVPLHLTDFANDPEHPRRTSDVRELLASTDERIEIPSAETFDDLRTIALRIEPPVLPAGGADFFSAILSREFKLGPWRCEIDPSGDHLFICGSASASSALAIRDAEARGVPVVPMAAHIFNALAPDETDISQWASQVIDCLRSNHKALVCVNHPPVPQQALRVRQMLAKLTQTILKVYPPAMLWIEGGATAAAIVDEMKWRSWSVVGTLSPGVVELLAGNQRLIIKPGSYAWPAGAL